MTRRTLFVLCAAVGLMACFAVAPAGAGNSANAKLCQKDGWQALHRADGSSFANQGACVSYGAKGGTPALPSTSKPGDARPQCESYGGIFSQGAPGRLWTCDGWTFTDPASFEARSEALTGDCFADGGSSSGTRENGGIATTTCS